MTPAAWGGAALTGAIVSTGIAMAGSIAWFVSGADPAGESDALPVGATAPIDADHVRAGADPLSLEQGRIYYVQICLHCHGARGDGRGEWAYRVTPRPADLRSRRTQQRSDAELFEIISEPRSGTPMIGWKNQLSEGQRQHLVAYLRHLGARDRTETRH